MGRREGLQRGFDRRQPFGSHQLDQQVALAYMAACRQKEKVCEILLCRI